MQRLWISLDRVCPKIGFLLYWSGWSVYEALRIAMTAIDFYHALFVRFVSCSNFSLLVELENTCSAIGGPFAFPKSAHNLLASVSRGFLEIWRLSWWKGLTCALRSAVGGMPGLLATEKPAMWLSRFEGDYRPSETCVLKLEMCGWLAPFRNGKELRSRLSGCPWSPSDVRTQWSLLKKRSVWTRFMRRGPSPSVPLISESEDSIQVRPICRE